MNDDRNSFFRKTNRVVVKIGSGVLTQKNGLDLPFIRTISRQINDLMTRGIEVILVSSGALACGIKKINLPARPHEITVRQAAAAVGQAGLIREYEKAFDKHGKQVAQILLTGNGMTHRKRYLNARNTLNKLLSWNVLPVINENDTVSIEEIKFGDNDNLAAVITLMMDAHILISLTDIDGLFSSDPRMDPEGKLIPIVSKIDESILSLASAVPGTLGLGGMLGKINAARKVTAAGVPMAIARGNAPDILTRLFTGEPVGTFFLPGAEKISSRKRWIGFTLDAAGSMNIDSGAAAAILKRGKSLLPSGITGVSGNFDVGAAVTLKTESGKIIATGLTNYSVKDVRKIMGIQTDSIEKRLGYKLYDEVIHRDNLVLTIGP